MWFSDRLESYGVKYAEYFIPIPLTTIALVTTMVSFRHDQHPNHSHLAKIESCLNKWKTGAFVCQKLHEPTLKDKFSGHLKDVIKWDSLTPEVTINIHQKIFDDLWYVLLCHHSSIQPYSECPSTVHLLAWLTQQHLHQQDGNKLFFMSTFLQLFSLI